MGADTDTGKGFAAELFRIDIGDFFGGQHDEIDGDTDGAACKAADNERAGFSRGVRNGVTGDGAIDRAQDRDVLKRIELGQELAKIPMVRGGCGGDG